MKTRKPLDHYVSSTLKKKMKEAYDVLNYHKSSELSYKIASESIKEIQKILKSRGVKF